MNINNQTYRQILLALIGVIVIFALLLMDNLSTKIVGFWGSIIGGIIGGLFTYLGVKSTIDYEREKARVGELTSILIKLLIIMEELKQHMGLSKRLKDSFEFSDENSYEDLFRYLEEFEATNQLLISKLTQDSVSIDIESYSAVRKLSEIQAEIDWLFGRVYRINASIEDMENNKIDIKKVTNENFREEVITGFKKVFTLLVDCNRFMYVQYENYLKEYKHLKGKNKLPIEDVEM